MNEEMEKKILHSSCTQIRNCPWEVITKEKPLFLWKLLSFF